MIGEIIETRKELGLYSPVQERTSLMDFKEVTCSD